MNTAEQLERKRQRNREYYERNKERIKQRQRERYYQLKLVDQPPLEFEEAECVEKVEVAEARVTRHKTFKPFDIRRPIHCQQNCCQFERSEINRENRFRIPKPKKPLKILRRIDADLDGLSWTSEECSFKEKYPDWDAEETTTELSIECLRSLGMTYQVQAYEYPKNVEIIEAEKSEESIWDKIFQPEIFLRLLFSIAMTTFLIFLQIEFYEKHDSTAYPVAMAIACELSLICLALTKFRCPGSERLRKLVFGGLFLYVIGSLSFSVYSEARLDSTYTVSEEVPKDERSKLERRLATAELALEKATKGRSWDNMILFGKQVTDIQIQIQNLETKTSLGVTDDFMSGIQVLLLVLLRVSLLTANSVNADKLRESLRLDH